MSSKLAPVHAGQAREIVDAPIGADEDRGLPRCCEWTRRRDGRQLPVINELKSPRSASSAMGPPIAACRSATVAINISRSRPTLLKDRPARSGIGMAVTTNVVLALRSIKAVAVALRLLLNGSHSKDNTDC